MPRAYTGNSFADFLLGTAAGYKELAVQDHGNWPNVSWAAYIQDNWRATNRLTLNLGLRWDGAPHAYESDNRMGNFYPYTCMIRPRPPCLIVKGYLQRSGGSRLYRRKPWTRHQPEPDPGGRPLVPQRNRNA